MSINGEISIRLLLGIICLGILGIIHLVQLVSCDYYKTSHETSSASSNDSSSSDSSDSSYSSNTSYPSLYSWTRLTDDCLAFLLSKDYDRASELASSDDLLAFQNFYNQCIAMGTAIWMKSGTSVYVEDRSVFHARVQVHQEGSSQRYWVKATAF